MSFTTKIIKGKLHIFGDFPFAEALARRYGEISGLNKAQELDKVKARRESAEYLIRYGEPGVFTVVYPQTNGLEDKVVMVSMPDLDKDSSRVKLPARLLAACEKSGLDIAFLTETVRTVTLAGKWVERFERWLKSFMPVPDQDWMRFESKTCLTPDGIQTLKDLIASSDASPEVKKAAEVLLQAGIKDATVTVR